MIQKERSKFKNIPFERKLYMKSFRWQIVNDNYHNLLRNDD